MGRISSPVGKDRALQLGVPALILTESIHFLSCLWPLPALLRVTDFPFLLCTCIKDKWRCAPWPLHSRTACSMPQNTMFLWNAGNLGETFVQSAQPSRERPFYLFVITDRKEMFDMRINCVALCTLVSWLALIPSSHATCLCPKNSICQHRFDLFSSFSIFFWSEFHVPPPSAPGCSSIFIRVFCCCWRQRVT